MVAIKWVIKMLFSDSFNETPCHEGLNIKYER
jgi:hypothetical protein